MTAHNTILSDAIRVLRFPLIVGVVLIHNNLCDIMVGGRHVSAPPEGDWVFAHYFMTYFSDVLPRICVPLFFAISGYLFFYRTTFDNSVYRRKLASRLHTLLLPYVMWNMVGFLIQLIRLCMAGRCPSAGELVGMLAGSFWTLHVPGEGTSSMPADFVLWFVRDLMVVVLFTPLLHALIRRWKALPVAAMGVLWFGGWVPDWPGASLTAFFFFGAGACVALMPAGGDGLRLSRGRLLMIAYLFVSVADTFDWAGAADDYVHRLGILLGIPACVCFASRWSALRPGRWFALLTQSSFFVYAFHGLFIGNARKVLCHVLPPDTPLSLLVVYVGVPVLIIAAGVAGYVVLRRFPPSFARLFTGGR